MDLSKWSRGLRFRIAVPAVIQVLAIVVLGALSTQMTARLGGDIERAARVHTPLMQLSADMESRVHQIVRYTWGIYGAGMDTAQRKSLNEQATHAVNEFEKARAAYEALPSTPEAKKLYDSVPGAWKNLREVTEKILGTLGKNDPRWDEMAKYSMTTELREAAAPVTTALAKLSEYQAAHQAEEAMISIDSARSARNWILGFSSLAFVIASILTAWIASRLSNTLQIVVGHVASSGEQVSEASQQLNAASHRLSGSASQAAASIEETSASVEELSAQIRVNAEHAKNASDLSAEATSSAESGEAEARRLTGAMSDISASSKKIEDIIGIIDDIAFQTNLLALNAAVEAARAGEQGKGFAVVAEAVRTLAARSASAAKDISDLIKGSVSNVNEGTKIAESTGKVLQHIVTSIKKVAALNDEIAKASQEQANTVSQIGLSMNELDRTTQENAAAAEEVSSSSSAMDDQAASLRAQVAALAQIIEGRGDERGAYAADQSADPADSASDGDAAASPDSRHAA